MVPKPRPTQHKMLEIPGNFSIGYLH